MQTRLRFQSRSLRKLRWAAGSLLAALLIGYALPRLPLADDTPPSPGAPEKVGEEIDIFKERQREIARREKQLAKQSASKKKTPDTIKNMFTWTPMAPTNVGDGPGMISTFGHLIGPTFGRSSSITPLEVMPYMLTDEHFFFSDVRGFITNNSQAGGNAGLGYRYLREDWNAWGGASLWYDADQSTSKLFQQVGLSFEGLIQRFELRSNVYIPVSASQNISNTVGNAAIVGNQLLYGRTIDVGTALTGVDAEFGYSLPVREKHVVRGFVGGYHFSSASTADVNGFKARIEGVINNGITAQALYTNDNLYGSNLMVGLSVQFPFGNNHPTSGWNQHTPSPFRTVVRNYNVIVSQNNNNAGNQVASDPTTGNAYKIEQVYAPNPGGGPVAPVSGTASGAGTTSDPFNSIAAAQAAGGNVIIVQNGSVLNEAVTLTSGQHLFGQGLYAQSLAVTGGGTVQIPNLVKAAQPGSSIQSPILENTNGTAVTLASNTEAAGFTFSGSSGNAISATNASGIYLHDLTFSGNTGDAINLSNSAGNVTMKNIQIESGGGNGVVIDGGTANIAYYGAGNSISVTGDGFVLSNLTGGTVGLSSLNLKNTGGSGLVFDTVGTSVAVDSLTTTGTGGPAVSISGDTGHVGIVNGVQANIYNTYGFTGFTAINSPKGTGFLVNSTDAIVNVSSLNVTSSSSAPAVSLVNDLSSAISISSLNLTTNGGEGLSTVGLEMLNVSGGAITSTNAPAIDIQSSTINTTLTSVSANGGPFGVSLAQSLGIFNITGSGSTGSGGTIQNTTTGVKITSFAESNIGWIDFLNNGTAIQSHASTILNLYNLQISGTTGYALDSLDDSSVQLSNSTMVTNGAVGGGTIRIQADTSGTYSSTLSGNTITDANGTAIQYLSSSALNPSLSALVETSTINGFHGGSPIIGVNWNGPVGMTISNNYLNAYASNMTAMQIQDPSITSSLSAAVSNNAVTFAVGATQGTGLSILEGTQGQTSSASSTLLVQENSFDFGASGGIGMRYALYGTSVNNILSNIVTDQAGGATGMLFDYVAANSTLTINGNTINLLSTDLTTHQGIIFTQVAPTIQFNGTVNNLIYNATSVQSLFSIPVNSAAGQLLINGSLDTFVP